MQTKSTMTTNDINRTSSEDDDPFMVLSYSDSTVKAITYLYYLTPLISLVGSSLLLYVIETGKGSSLQYLKRPFLRLLWGFAAMDVFQSGGSLAFGPWSVPEGTPYVWNASGNVATCNANGFFSHFFLGLVLYSAFHASYSAMTIYFRLRDQFIARFIEPFFHVIAWGWTVASGLLLIFQGMMNPAPSNPGFCWSSDFPPDCRFNPNVDCIRGADQNHQTQAFIFLGGTVIVSFLTIIISFGLIYSKVRNTEEKLNRWSERSNGLSGSFHSIYSVGTTGQSTIDQSSYHYKKFKPLSDKVGRQALAYIVAFMLCNLPILISAFGPRYSEPHAKTYYIINAITFEVFTPLQGAFNALIFFYNNPCIFRRGGPLYFLNRFQKLPVLLCCKSSKRPENFKRNSASSVKTKSQQQEELDPDCPQEEDLDSFESFCIDLAGNSDEESRVNSCMSNITPESSSEARTISSSKSCPGNLPAQICDRKVEEEGNKIKAARNCLKRSESLPLQCIRLSDSKSLFNSSLSNSSEIEPIPEKRNVTKFGLSYREGCNMPVDVLPRIPLRVPYSSEEVSSSEECSAVCLSLGSLLQKHSSDPSTGSRNSIDDEGSLPNITTTSEQPPKTTTSRAQNRRNDSDSKCSFESSIQGSTQWSVTNYPSNCSSQDEKDDTKRHEKDDTKRHPQNSLVQYWNIRQKEIESNQALVVLEDLERSNSSALSE